ncbi:MAG: PEP-CTERM sorting domain-containing protein [Sphingomonas sp.]|nr:PEP-CTERM sorting domain-containing protein [Sphingomonas sp.]
MAAKDAASDLIFNFSDQVALDGGLTSANGGSFTLLSFSTPSNVGSGNALLVSNAVPEPATWLMLIGGFGAVGFALRRRQRLAPAFAT